ncbi:MAG: DUF2309 domain-containing protein [Chloroflexi bacterium]|nr:DUF2309 domain-containing protein [Chloroflexota bacterium]
MEILDSDTKGSVQAEMAEYVAFCIKQAATIIAPYWPISTFIANNSLGGLENTPFHQAMEYAWQLRGSQGYLSLAAYHDFFLKGRITEADLTYAISNFLREKNWPELVSVGGKAISPSQMATGWLIGDETYPKVINEKGRLWEEVSRRLQTLPHCNEPGEEKDALARIETQGEKCLARDGQTVTSIINKRLIKWCAAFLDEGQAAWTMPGREQGFYGCWKALAGMDHSFRYYTGQNVTKKLEALPKQASQALTLFLQALEIPLADWPVYLARHLAQLPGWASLIKWREEHPEAPEQQRYPITLTEYLAVRLFYETLLIEEAALRPKSKTPYIKAPALLPSGQNQPDPGHKEATATIACLVQGFEVLGITPDDLETTPSEIFGRMVQLAGCFNDHTRQRIWQEAYEWHYRNRLLSELSQAQPRTPGVLAGSTHPVTQAAQAQAVFCIDVRSEGLRRHLEKRGAYETFGFAGFFGIPMLYQPFGSPAALAIAPALITPTRLIKEQPSNTPSAAIERRLRYNGLRYVWAKLRRTVRENLLTPFAFVEMTGWLSLFSLAGKTVAPRAWRKLRNSLHQRLCPVVSVEPSILTDPAELSLVEQAGAVASMLRSIGLTGQFARLVLLCGHGSETENNPYASALDCGACGGNHGGPSANVAAGILNSKEIRQLLHTQGIVIPDETFFLAGEHNTTTDTVRFLNEAYLPKTHQAEFENFKRDLALAGQANAVERWPKLTGTTAQNPTISRQVERRASDWAQVRPEWGLVRNAAFICGRRDLTRQLNLDNRVFLHSYDPLHDPDGTILEGILTAPVIVAEWINMQYYFSSIHNQGFGSGTKLLHNIVSEIGVMQGQESDLLTGLPQQSVMVGEELYHEPMRLCVIVEASTATITQIIAKHEKLQHLTDNKWINLIAYNTQDNLFYEYLPQGKWCRVFDIP